MKIVKTMKQGLLYRVFEESHSYYLAVAVLQFFSFGRPGLLSEVGLWEFAADKLGKDAMLDMGMPKPRGEVLVFGKCFAPGGRPVKACPVRFTIGPVDKSLNLFGDRYWKMGILGGEIAGHADFTVMDLDWKNAFGGRNFPQNPLGKGDAPIILSDERFVRPLPNIEDPSHPVASPSDKPEPAGFGVVDITWPQRMAKVGTYDDKWLQEDFPGYAKDMDPTFFNTAPPDQWISGFWRGDERFELRNMHPDKLVVKGELPGFRPRLFTNRKTDKEPALSETKTRLETVWLFPDQEKGVLLHRGVTEIGTDDGSDVLHLMIGYEELKGEPESFEHYRKEFEKRTDEEKGFLYFLKDAGLAPEAEAARQAEELAGEPDDIGDRMAELGRKKAEKQYEKMKAELKRLGVDTTNMPPLPPPPPKVSLAELDPEEIIKMLADAEKMAETKKAEAMERLKEMCAKVGVDQEKVLERARAMAGKRMTFSADEIIASMKQHGGIKPEVEEKLRNGEKQFKAVYKKTVHHMPPPPSPAPAEATRLKDRFTILRAAGGGFAGQDLAGIDLAGMDLRSIDMKDVLLEGANLSGADLSGADLSGAVLAHANLKGASFVKTRLVEANLGAADLVRADFSGADLTGGVLAKADLTEANFTGAVLNEVEFLEIRFKNTKLAGAKMPGALLLNMDLEGTDFTGADISEAILTSPKLNGANFTGAKAVGTMFIGAQAEKALFKNADMTNARMVQESKLAGADFSGAILDQANLMEADLTGANFEKARMNESNFMKAVLVDANLIGAVARRANFIQTDFSRAKMVGMDLMEANLMKARLVGADIRLASLYGAEVMKAVLGETDFSMANLKMTKLARYYP